MEDKRVKEFLESKNESTRREYRRAFGFFRNYAKSELGEEVSGTDLIRTVAEDRRRDVEDRRRPEVKLLKGFFNWLRHEAPRKSGGRGNEIVGRGQSLKSAHKYVSALTAFLSYNDLPVSRKRLSLPRPTRKRSNRKMNIRREQVRKLVDHAKTNRDKAIVLCLWQSGMGVGELLSLKVGDVMVEDPVRGSLDDPPLLIKLVRKKAGVEYRTFFGRDACEALKRYIDERERTRGEVKLEDPLFIQQRKMGEEGYGSLSTTAVDILFQRLAKRAGLVSEEKLKEADLNPARPHALRAGFASVLKEEGVNQSIVDGLQGHRVSYDSAYHNFTDKQLRELYKEHEDVLSIERVSIPKEDEIKEAVEKHFGEMGVERIMPELREKVEEQGSRVRELEAEVEELREKIRKIDELGVLLEKAGALAGLKEAIERAGEKATEGEAPQED